MAATRKEAVVAAASVNPPIILMPSHSMHVRPVKLWQLEAASRLLQEAVDHLRMVDKHITILTLPVDQSFLLRFGSVILTGLGSGLSNLAD